MKTEAFLDRLKGVKKSGFAWIALCPAHDDRSPSLSVRLGDLGGIIVHCHAGCKPDAVTESMGLTLRDLAPENPAEAPPRLVNASPRVTRYEVIDHLGNLVAIHERTDKADGTKSFSWMQRNGERGLGGRKQNTLPLYGGERLGEVSPDGVVIVTEGEKAAAALQGIGVLALGTYGAEVVPSPEVLGVLRGHRVILWADNDEPGRRHMERIRVALQGVAASVQIVKSGGPKNDAADFVAEGGTAEGIRDILRKSVEKNEGASAQETARPEREKGGGRGPLAFTSWADLCEEPEEVASWLWEGHLPTGGLSMFSGKPKSGKSTLVRCLCRAVLTGGTFLGRSVIRGPVAYLALEEKREEVKAHFVAMGVPKDAAFSLFIGRAPEDCIGQLKLWLKKQLPEKRPVLIVIDPLFKAVRVSDGNDYAKVSQALEPVLELARESGIHVLLVHHEGKGERSGFDAMLGSTALRGGGDANFSLRRTGDRRTLVSEQRYGKDFPETILELDPRTREVRAAGLREEVTLQEMSGSMLEAFREAGGEPMTEEEILSRVQGTTGHKRAALRLLCDQTEVERLGTGKRGNPFQYRLAGHEVGEDSIARLLVRGIGDERANEKLRMAG